MLTKFNFIENNFILFLLVFFFVGLIKPGYFIWSKNLTFPLLSLIAFCVGLNLKIKDFDNVWENKKLLFSALIFKYTLVPVVTLWACALFHLSVLYTISLVTITCCPAANTGNIMCYLAKGNTAIIVVATIIGSLLAPLITPTIIYLLLHKVVHISFSDITSAIITGITVPTMTGVLIGHYFLRKPSPIKYIMPSIGVLSISIIIGTIVSQHANEMMELDIKVPLLVIALIIIFLSSGFIFSYLISPKLKNAIAMSFEIGTFDGVLGIFLTSQIIGKAGALPVVIFAILNIIIGSMISKIYTSSKFLELAK